MGPCLDPKELGFVSFGGRTQGFWVLLRPDPKGLCLSVSILRGVGSLSGPKRVGVWVLQSTNAWGVGFASGPKGVGGWVGWGGDPRGVVDGFMS